MQDSYIDDSVSVSGFGGKVERALRWGGAMLSAALIAAIIVWAYKLGVRDAREVPVIRAMEGPARTQPADPGGAQADHQGLEVNEVLAGAAPASPDAPMLAPQGAGLTDEDVAGLTVPGPETPVDQPNDFLEPGTFISDDLIVPEAILDDLPPEAEPTLAAPVVEPEPEAAEPVTDIASLIEAVQAEADQQAALEPENPFAAIPDVRPRIRPNDLNTSVTLGPTETPVAERAQVPPGTRVVQLGAFDTPEDAEGEWARLVEAHGDLLISKARYIEQATNAGRVFYRLRAVGFETSNDSKAMCDALTARGVACIPVIQR